MRAMVPTAMRPRGSPLTALATAVAAMDANSMAEYTGTNINASETSNHEGSTVFMLESTGNYPITNWAGKFGFDAANGLIAGVGTAQGFSSYTPAGGRSKAVYFDLAADAFSVAWAPTARNEGHIYDGNSSVPMGGYFYRRGYNSNVIWRMSSPGKVWESFLTTTSFTGSAEQVVACEAFPTLGASGSLILVGATGKVWRYDLATATGTLLDTVTGTGNYAVCIYVPGADKVVLGGGATGTKLYTLDTSATRTEISQTLPGSVEVACSSTSGPTVAHPGNEAAILTFNNVTEKVWELNLGTGTWTELMTFPAGFTGQADYSVATALHGLGAVALWFGNGRTAGVTTSEFWIYKA